MFKKILLIRYVFILGVIFTLINSIFFLVAGVSESIHGYMMFIQNGIDDTHKPGIFLLKGLDLFLVSMVFLIFALGIMRLFTHYNHNEEDLPGWLKIGNFKELKVLLWETVLVTLVVFTLTEIVAGKQALDWTALILPGIIFLLTLSLYLMKRNDMH